jgi:hypothetical protein
MNLREPNISSENVTEIYRLLNEEITQLNLGGFMVLYESDGLQNAIGNTHSWLAEVFGALILK